MGVTLLRSIFSQARYQEIIKAISRWAFSIPFTWIILTIALTVSILQRVFQRSVGWLLEDFLSVSFDSFFVDHRWFSGLTAVLLADRGAHLLIAVPIILLVLGSAERLMGSGRTAAVYLGVAVVGSGVGIIFQGIGLWFGIFAAEAVRSHHTIDPLIPVVGTIMAASAFARPLLRRRIRLLGFAGLSMFVLYSGMPSDLYRMVAAVFGLLLGLFLNKKSARLMLRRSSHRELRSLLAAVVAITAIGPLISLISPEGFGPLQPLSLLFSDQFADYPVVATTCADEVYTTDCVEIINVSRINGVGPVLLTLLPLLLLLIAAWGIVLGRRVAAWIAIGVNVFFSFLAALYFGLLPALGAETFFRFSDGAFDQYNLSVVISIALPCLVALVLLFSLRIFPTDFSVGSTVTFFVGVVGSFLLISVLYLSAAWSVRDQFEPTVTLNDLLVDLPERFMPVGFLFFERLDVVPVGNQAQMLYQWVGAMFWIAVIVEAVLAISHFQLGSAANSVARVRTLLRSGVGGSLSWMTTWSAHHYWFSRDRSAAVAYRVINGVAIVTGEPLCAKNTRLDTIVEFSEFCSSHGWVPVFYAVSENARTVFQELHWSVMKVAEEEIIDPAQWSLEGKKMQDVRTAINKATKLNIRAEWLHYSQLSSHAHAQIRDISEQWVAEKNLPEMGFTLGGFDEMTDPEVRLMIAFDSENRVHGVTSWLPSYREGVIIGWTLDFMRRRFDGMPGVMEFLIAETIIRSRDHALDWISLSASPLVNRAGAEKTSPPSLLSILGRALEPVYGLESLAFFKQKFQPTSRPLFLAYADALTLPVIGMSLARAYMPSLSAKHALKLLVGTENNERPRRDEQKQKQ